MLHNRWLYKDKVGDPKKNEAGDREVLELFVGAICDVAKGYTPDALSVWPASKREEMLIAMGKESSVLFGVLKMVSQGPQPIAMVREEFEKQGKGKELESKRSTIASPLVPGLRAGPSVRSESSGPEVIQEDVMRAASFWVSQSSIRHGSSASMSSWLFAVGSFSKTASRYRHGSSPLALAVSTRL